MPISGPKLNKCAQRRSSTCPVSEKTTILMGRRTLRNMRLECVSLCNGCQERGAPSSMNVQNSTAVRAASYGKTIIGGCCGTVRDSLRDTLSRTCPAVPPLVKRSTADAAGQCGTACGTHCPAPVPQPLLWQNDQRRMLRDSGGQLAGHAVPHLSRSPSYDKNITRDTSPRLAFIIL